MRHDSKQQLGVWVSPRLLTCVYEVAVDRIKETTIIIGTKLNPAAKTPLDLLSIFINIRTKAEMKFLIQSESMFG